VKNVTFLGREGSITSFRQTQLSPDIQQGVYLFIAKASLINNPQPAREKQKHAGKVVSYKA
jgi:hypothetical protein